MKPIQVHKSEFMSEYQALWKEQNKLAYQNDDRFYNLLMMFNICSSILVLVIPCHMVHIFL